MVTTTVSHTTTRFEYALQLNIEGVRHSLHHMPDSTYKAYCLWALDTPQIAGRWLQLMGIESLIRLTGSLLDDLLSADQWLQLVPYSVPINVSQMYEVVSDNLAIGLGQPAPEDTAYHTRSQLIYTFNQATIERLRGDSPQSARALLDPFIPLMRKISTFEQSLSADKHRLLAGHFIKNHPRAAMRELEYALHPLLVANLETCIDLTKVLADSASYTLLVNGLIGRYQGVNDLLEQQAFSLDDLLAISTHTIMVVPTLAYYIGVIAERVYPLPAYPAVLADGSLLSILEDAALLVRLLNDMGTLLLEQTPADRRVFIQRLRHMQQQGDYPTFEHLLLEATGQQRVLLTRMCKDVTFGEFNVGLHPVRQVDDVAEAVEVFADQLQSLALVYQERLHGLPGRIARLNQRLGSPLVGEIIMRFVQFHRYTYSHAFETPQGEYAV